MLSGPPPLGPGAPPHKRLETFLRRLADLTERNLALLLACEPTPSSRHRLGGYGAWHQHTSILVGQIDPSLDAFYADMVLAPLGPALYAHHRRDRRTPANDMADRVVAVARRLVG